MVGALLSVSGTTGIAIKRRTLGNDEAGFLPRLTIGQAPGTAKLREDNYFPQGSFLPRPPGLGSSGKDNSVVPSIFTEDW